MCIEVGGRITVGKQLSKENHEHAFEKRNPELEKDNRYTSPASALPLYELKMLQEYIHDGNLQNLGKSLPLFKKNLMLNKFFKHNRFRQVEVFSTLKADIVHSIGKVHVVGRDFVQIKTLFQRIWIPYSVIQTAKSPFGIPDISNSHQHINYDPELRRKLLTQFGNVVSEKEDLRQQFFEQLLETNLRYRKGYRLKVFLESKEVKGRLTEAKSGKLYLKNSKMVEMVPIREIQLIKQIRFFSSLTSMFKDLIKSVSKSK